MKIGDYCEIISGYAFDSKAFNADGIGTPLIRIRDVGKAGTDTYFEGDFPATSVVNDGDFLIGMDGEFRLAQWCGGKALLNQRVCKIVPNESIVNTKYIMRLLPAELSFIEDRTSFATVKHLSTKKIKNIEIPLPPLDEQKKIAAILDAADELRQKDKALIAKYDELTQSLFLDMFGEVEANSMGWEKAQLNQVCQKITDGEHGTVKRVEQGNMYLMARNVGKNGIIYDEVSFINQEDHEKIFKRCNPEEGDLLLVCVGATIGRCCLVPKSDEFSLARSVALIKPNRSLLNSDFLLHHFKDTGFKNQLMNRRNTSAQAGLYTGQIKQLEIALPPIALQKQFSEYIQSIEEQKAKTQETLEKSEHLFNSLLQKAFKGELTN